MVLATLLHKLRSVSHGGGAHFWAVTIPVAACGDRLNSQRERQRCSVIWLHVLVPHIRAHLATDSHTPILDAHLAERFLATSVGFPKRILEVVL
jgi:hypothetical protein